MNADEFRKVQAMSDEEQRELLRGGDSRHRVWAAWALGLRLADGFSDQMRAALAEEPVPGVRRHMAVMMAGYGEVDILVALARHDPDQFVRATAAQYVAGLSEAHPALGEILSDLLGDESARVRAAVVRGLPTSAPDELRRRIVSATSSTDDELRGAAVRHIIERGEVSPELWRAFLIDRIASLRRDATVALCDRVGAPKLLAVAAESGWLDEALGALRLTGVKVRFDGVAVLNPDERWTSVLDVSALGPRGRVWLMGLDRRKMRSWTERTELLLEVYETIESVSDPVEQDAVNEFTTAMEDKLKIDADGDAKPRGELVEYGRYTPFQFPEHRLLTKMRHLLG